MVTMFYCNFVATDWYPMAMKKPSFGLWLLTAKQETSLIYCFSIQKKLKKKYAPLITIKNNKLAFCKSIKFYALHAKLGFEQNIRSLSKSGDKVTETTL